MKKKLVNSIIGALTAFVMTGMVPMTSIATEPATGEGVSSQTIPVTATVDDYYIVSMPANLDGSGNLNLTREYTKAYKGDAGYIETTGSDTHHTFYGYTTVGVMGSISDGKKVTASLTCDPLVKTGDTGTTADVGMKRLIDNDASKAAIIWDLSKTVEQKAENSLTFPNENADWTTGTIGVLIDFLNIEVNPTAEVSKSAMLRTTLPVDGIYESNLVINFSLRDWRSSSEETGTFAMYRNGCISKVEILDSAGNVIHETTMPTETLGIVPGGKIRLTHGASYNWFYHTVENGNGGNLGAGSTVMINIPLTASGAAVLFTSGRINYDNLDFYEERTTGWISDPFCYPILGE